MDMIPQYFILSWNLFMIVAVWFLDSKPLKDPYYRFKEYFVEKLLYFTMLVWGGFFDNLFTITFK